MTGMGNAGYIRCPHTSGKLPVAGLDHHGLRPRDDGIIVGLAMMDFFCYCDSRKYPISRLCETRRVEAIQQHVAVFSNTSGVEHVSIFVTGI